MTVLKNVFNSYSFEITEDNMITMVKKDLTGYKVKYIRLIDFAKAIIAATENEKDEDMIIHQGEFLPKGIIKCKKTKNGSDIYAIESEACKIDIIYGEKTFYNVGIPRLIYGVKILGNAVQKTWIVAIKNDVKRIQNNTILYEFPLSNIYGIQGNVCWGSVKIPEYNDHRDLKNLIKLFLSSPFNNHNYGNHRNLSNLELRPLLETLQGKDFPEEWLKKRKETFGQWFEDLK